MEDLPEFLKRDGHRRRPQQTNAAAAAAEYYYDGDDGEGGGAGPPWIDPETPTNVTVVAGKTAILACVVRQLGTASVSELGLHTGSRDRCTE